MKITLDNQIRIPISDLPIALYKAITSDLTIDNPQIPKLKRLGKWTGSIPKKLTYYRLENNTLLLPRGYWQQLMKRLADSSIYQIGLDDVRVTPWAVDYGSVMVPRPYQVEPIEKMIWSLQKTGGAVLISPAGSGKTNMGLETVARLKLPALWLTHTKDLAEQTKERAESLLSKVGPIGMIGDGRKSVGAKLTIGMVQTLSKMDLEDLALKFGTIIVDECHHCPSSLFSEVASQFPARYIVGLTATPDREDGLGPVMFFYLGQEAARVSHSELHGTGSIIVPEVKVVYTGYRRPVTGAVGVREDFNYTELLNEMMADETRNKLIAQQVLDYAPGHYSLVLSERVEHLQILKDQILKEAEGRLWQPPRITILHGGIPKKERTAIIERCKNREVDILLATQLAREGLDITHLDRLFWALPKRAAGAVEQEAGRIMRSSPGKTGALIVDFVDYDIGPLKSQHFARMKVLRKLGCQTPRKPRESTDSLQQLLTQIKY